MYMAAERLWWLSQLNIRCIAGKFRAHPTLGGEFYCVYMAEWKAAIS